MVEPTSHSESGEIMEFNCHDCNRRLSIPSSHYGRVRCPDCGKIQRTSITSSFDWGDTLSGVKVRINNTFDGIRSTEVTRNHVSIGFTIGGILLGIITIAVFLNGFTGTWCEEYQSITYIDENGQEAVGQTCADNQLLFENDGFKKLISSIGLSCFLLLPISVFLLLFGLALRDDSQNVLINSEAIPISKPSFADSTPIRIVQKTAAGLGIGAIALTIIVTSILLILFVVLIALLISSPPAGYGG